MIEKRRIIPWLAVMTWMMVAASVDGRGTSRKPENECEYEGVLYKAGQEVPTGEPCLRCSCKDSSLVCHLRVCPRVPDPLPEGCHQVKQAGLCCPRIVCEDELETNRLYRKEVMPMEEEEEEEMTTTLQPPQFEVEVTTNTTSIIDTSSTGRGCFVNGAMFAEGSAMISPDECTYCFCIKGEQKCVTPRCLLPVEGCRPTYRSFSCCPAFYDCHEASSTTTTTDRSTSGCIVKGKEYSEGSKIESMGGPCESCYCLRGELTCATISCAPPMRGCTPILQEGRCCPISYNCGDDVRSRNELDEQLKMLVAAEDTHPPEWKTNIARRSVDNVFIEDANSTQPSVSSGEDETQNEVTPYIEDLEVTEVDTLEYTTAVTTETTRVTRRPMKRPLSRLVTRPSREEIAKRRKGTRYNTRRRPSRPQRPATESLSYRYRIRFNRNRTDPTTDAGVSTTPMNSVTIGDLHNTPGEQLTPTATATSGSTQMPSTTQTGTTTTASIPITDAVTEAQSSTSESQDLTITTPEATPQPQPTAATTITTRTTPTTSITVPDKVRSTSIPLPETTTTASDVDDTEASSPLKDFSVLSTTPPAGKPQVLDQIEIGTGVNVKGNLENAVAFGPILILDNRVRTDRKQREGNATDATSEGSTQEDENLVVTESPAEETTVIVKDVNTEVIRTATDEITSILDSESQTASGPEEETTTLLTFLDLQEPTVSPGSNGQPSATPPPQPPPTTTTTTTTTTILSTSSERISPPATTTATTTEVDIITDYDANDTEDKEEDFASYDITVGTSVLATNQVRPGAVGVGEVIPVDLKPEHKAPETITAPEAPRPSFLGTILDILTRPERPQTGRPRPERPRPGLPRPDRVRPERPRPERPLPERTQSERPPLERPRPPVDRTRPERRPPIRPSLFRPRPKPEAKPDSRPDFVPPRFRFTPPTTTTEQEGTEPPTTTSPSPPVIEKEREPIIRITSTEKEREPIIRVSSTTEPLIDPSNIPQPVRLEILPPPPPPPPPATINEHEHPPVRHPPQLSRPDPRPPLIRPNTPFGQPTLIPIPTGSSSHDLPSEPIIESGFQGIPNGGEGIRPNFDFSEYDADGEPTLPPSLPNLRIIPFVAADALTNQEFSISGEDFRSTPRPLSPFISQEGEETSSARPTETSEDVTTTPSSSTTTATTTTSRRPIIPRLPIGDRRPPILPPRRSSNRPSDGTSTRRPFLPFRRPGDRPTRPPFLTKTTTAAPTTAAEGKPNPEEGETRPPFSRPKVPFAHREHPSTRPPFIPPRRPTFITTTATTTTTTTTSATTTTTTERPSTTSLGTAPPRPTFQTNVPSVAQPISSTSRPILSDDIANLLLQDLFELPQSQNPPPVRFTPARSTPKPILPVKVTTNLPDIPSAVKDQLPLGIDPILASGLLKLSACNIYGRMYEVGKRINELSAVCKECQCTPVGVQCLPIC